jgi:hypothetical protein
MAVIQYPGARCGQLDLTKIPIDDFIVIDNAAWIRASVEEKVYAYPNDRGKVVFKFNDPCVVTLCQNDFLVGKELQGATEAMVVIENLLNGDPSVAQYTTSEAKSQYYQTDTTDLTTTTQRRLDSALVNQYGLYPAAIMPCAVAIPLRSNIRPYGPYATGNFHNSCGGINVEVDKEIAPWVFGSVDLMNTAAMIRLLNFETDPLVIGTTGSVTVPCLPQISLGLSMLTQGPVLNGLSVNFGSGGISTTYSFQTFTPKFGSFSRSMLDRIKLIAKNRREQLKILRNNQVLNNRIARQRSKVDYRANPILTKQDGIGKEASLHRVFIAEMTDWWKDVNCGAPCTQAGLSCGDLLKPKTGEAWQVGGSGDAAECIPPCRGCSCTSVPMYGPYEEALSISSGNRLKDSEGFGTGLKIPPRHNSQRTVVGTETLSKQVLELRWDYQKKAFMSMDGLLGPISMSGDGNLPQYAKYEPKCHRQAPLSPQPPFFNCSGTYKIECPEPMPGFNPESDTAVPVDSQYYNQKIEQVFENPVQNPTDCHHHLGTVHGHVIDALGRKQRIDNHMIMNLNPGQDYADDYRFLGLRGPMVLHAWGYDTWGKPIPNEADSEAATMQGQFKDENLKDRFLCEWLSKPATWPVGPIDLRFDRDRGVWVAPPQDYKVTVVELLEDLDPLGTAKARLINKDLEAEKDYGPELWGFEGEKLEATSDKTSQYIVIAEDRVKASYKKGTRVYAHYDTFRCNYIVFGYTSDNETEIIRFKLYDNCAPSGSGCDWLAYAGYRDKFLNYHTKGIRIDCNGDPVDKFNKKISEEDILNSEKYQDIFVNLYDTVGQHGPAYGLFTTFDEWKEKAHNGFAAKVKPLISNTCLSSSSNNETCVTNNETPPPGSGECPYAEECGLGNLHCDGCPDSCLETYDILFLESYARFVHATLLQDLYPTECELLNNSSDEYKQNCPCGNASANIDIDSSQKELFYGNSPNGNRPRFFTKDGETAFRVFDPFFKEGDIASSFNSPFKRLKIGDRVLAVFNEQTKKYYIYQSETQETIIKFALLEDKKDINQVCTKAVRVDRLHRPIKENGTLIISDEELNENAVIVVDPIAEKTALSNNIPKNYSVFGPALGSNKLSDHKDGEILYHYDRGSYSGVVIKPFTGFGRLRDIPCLDICEHCPETSGSGSFNHNYTAYDILTLEHFANFVEFEAAEDIITCDAKGPDCGYVKQPEYAANYYHYYDGTQPIGRQHKDVSYHKNRLVNLNIYDVIPDTEQYKKRPSYIVGEIIGNLGQGCRGIAKLDSQKSTTDKLIYDIVDAQTQALFGKFKILNCPGAAELNYTCEVFNDVICEPKNVRIYWFGGGFEWSENDPLTCARRGKVKIINKHEWCGKWYHEPNPSGSNGAVINTDLDEYYIYDAYPIANVKFGKYDGCGPPSGCEDGCDYLDGIHPICCHPTVENCIGPFLTYSGAQYVAYWNEDKAEYNIINAEEAPLLIEGKLVNDINCCAGLADVEVYASSNNDDALQAEPVKTLVKNVENPRGWCGKSGDEIVIHRRQVNNCYTYKVLHIGKPCVESDTFESGNCLLGETKVPHDIVGCDYRFFNERIECIPGYIPDKTQQLMHGIDFGLMWQQTQSYQTKVIFGCWDGSTISVAGFSGYDGSKDMGQNIGVSNPSSCCSSGSVFSPPPNGLAWATATFFDTNSGCQWIITNAECCDSCEFPDCEDCIPTSG